MTKATVENKTPTLRITKELAQHETQLPTTIRSRTIIVKCVQINAHTPEIYDISRYRARSHAHRRTHNIRFARETEKKEEKRRPSASIRHDFAKLYPREGNVLDDSLAR